MAVEVAGYAILAMTTLDADFYQHKALKIVKWISSQRNGQGGFISTQVLYCTVLYCTVKALVKSVDSVGLIRNSYVMSQNIVVILV